MKRAPTVEEQQVQTPSKVKVTQERKSATLPKAQKSNTASTPMVVLNDERDYWERRGTKWIRHHPQPRRTLFIPIDGPGHAPTSTLEPYRTTHAINRQTDEVAQIKDEWTTTTDMPAELQYTWKGTTTFTLKDEFETTLEDVVAPPPEHPDTLYRKQEEQEADHNLHNRQSKRWRNTHLHTCLAEVGVLFVSKQKASKMPTNSTNQSSQSYRLTLHTSRHLQMSRT